MVCHQNEIGMVLNMVINTKEYFIFYVDECAGIIKPPLH